MNTRYNKICHISRIPTVSAPIFKERSSCWTKLTLQGPTKRVVRGRKRINSNLRPFTDLQDMTRRPTQASLKASAPFQKGTEESLKVSNTARLSTFRSRIDIAYPRAYGAAVIRRSSASSRPLGKYTSFRIMFLGALPSPITLRSRRTQGPESGASPGVRIIDREGGRDTTYGVSRQHNEKFHCPEPCSERQSQNSNVFGIELINLFRLRAPCWFVFAIAPFPSPSRAKITG